MDSLINFISNNTNTIIWAAAAAALGYGALLSLWILKQPAGDEKMQSIAAAIQEGASAYLKKQYQVVAVVAVILALILYILLDLNSAIGFLIGAILSALAGFLGMSIAVRANVRVAEAAKNGLSSAFGLAYKGG